MIINLSRRNNRSRTGPQTLFNFRRSGNWQWISNKFHVYSRYLVHSTTTGCKWLIFRFTTMMQRNQSAHTACGPLNLRQIWENNFWSTKKWQEVEANWSRKFILTRWNWVCRWNIFEIHPPMLREREFEEICSEVCKLLTANKLVCNPLSWTWFYGRMQ